MKVTAVSRWQMLAGPWPAAVAMTGGAATVTADDPVFAAIEGHRQAGQAWLTAMNAANVSGYDRAAEAALYAAHERVDDALINWLTTKPTTLAGVLATLDYAASTSPRDDDRSVLSDWDPPVAEDPGYELVKQFPAMVAAVLRQIGN